MNDVPAEVIEVTIRSGRKGTWRLLLGLDSLRLEPAEGGEGIEIARSELPERIEVQEMPVGPPLLVIRKPKRVAFSFDPEGARRFRVWLGPPTKRDLKAALKRRMAWGLPIGLLFVFTSLPWKGDPAAGIEAIPFDPVSAILGGSLVLMGLLMRVWPNPLLFLTDSIWFLALAGKILWDIAKGGSWLWMIVVVLILTAVQDGFRQFLRFRKYREEREDG